MDQGVPGCTFSNWAQTFTCTPQLSFHPSSEAEIRKILKYTQSRNERVKVVGKGHSPSDIACTDGFLIYTDKFNRLLNVDRATGQVMVEAGMTLEELNNELPQHGLALANLGAVSDVSVGGMIGTGTHGSGIRHGILATQVVKVRLMTAAGQVLELSNDGDNDEERDMFRAVQLHLGALGMLLTITLQCVKAFRLEMVQKPGTLNQVLDDLHNYLQHWEFFRFFWFPHTNSVALFQVKSTDKKVHVKHSWFWDVLISFYLFEFLLWLSSFMPILVPWINRLFFFLLFSTPRHSVERSDRAFNFDCLFHQHVQDWAIPLEKAKTVLLQLQHWLDNSTVGAHYPVEVRFVRRDSILLSPCYNQDTCFINIVMYRPYGKEVEREKYWKGYEAIMRSAGGRPHWAKAHSCGHKDMQEMFPELPRFLAIRQKLDPTGIFLNDYLQRTLIGPDDNTRAK
uniref:L-gulonolactone oxidase-like isoform X1 n=1 Tax=Myxine glutinosa TaxID=7769 RepID=UPI00358EFE28